MPAGTGRAPTKAELINGNITQSIRFPADEWDVTKAKRWLRAEDYDLWPVEKTEKQLRFRQVDPDRIPKAWRYRITTLKNGVQLVRAYR